MDEILASGERVNRAAAEFLKLDVQTALTFLFTVRSSEDETRRVRNRKAARRAYDTVVKLMKRVKLSEEDTRKLQVGLEQLRSELEEVGEVF